MQVQTDDSFERTVEYKSGKQAPGEVSATSRSGRRRSRAMGVAPFNTRLIQRAKALVVDHDPHSRRTLRAVLMKEDCFVIEAPSSEDALEEIKVERPDLVLLEINMPYADGFKTCSSIRAFSDVPIFVVSVRKSERDVVRALDAGADDYLVKPLRIQELLARIRAITRRIPRQRLPSINLPDFSVNFERRQITANNRPLHLTPTEFDLLEILVLNQGKTVSHLKLLHHLWGSDDRKDREALRVFVGQLRRKVELNPDVPRYIFTEPCIGYRFDPEFGKLTSTEPSTVAGEIGKICAGKALLTA